MVWDHLLATRWAFLILLMLWMAITARIECA